MAAAEDILANWPRRSREARACAVETGYALSFYTGPDEQTFELEPGTGIARFHYAHHGTTNEVEARLVSFERGSKGH